MTRKMDTLKKVTLLRVICVLIRLSEGEVDQMGKSNRVLFPEQHMRLLEANPNVQHVSETNISYTAEFRLAAVRANQEGQAPVEIFVNAGFDLDIIGHKKPKHCLKRWRDRYTTYEEQGLLEERRGTGRRPAGSLSAEEELKRAQAKIKLLDAEVDFLKKLDALERQKKRY